MMLDVIAGMCGVLLSLIGYAEHDPMILGIGLVITVLSVSYAATKEEDEEDD